MSTEAAPRPVSPVLKVLLLGPLALGAGYAFLALTLFSASTDGFFAWRMSPVTATLLGAGYGGGCAMLGLALRARLWVSVRAGVATGSLLTLLVLGACLLGRGSLYLTGGRPIASAAAWTWLALHLAAPPAGLAALGAQWFTDGTAGPRPPRLPWWVAGPMIGNGLAVALTGLVLYVVPDTAARHWPWQVSALDVRVLGAWCLALGIALLLGWRERELRRMRGGMAALVVTGLFGLIGLVRYADRISWSAPPAWMVVLVLTVLLGLGVCGAGICALPDPPERRPAPGRAPGADLLTRTP